MKGILIPHLRSSKMHHQEHRFQKEKQERFPMKALFRSFLVALMLLGGYAGFTTTANATSTHLPGSPMPPR
jgi:hypothetical protein